MFLDGESTATGDGSSDHYHYHYYQIMVAYHGYGVTYDMVTYGKTAIDSDDGSIITPLSDLIAVRVITIAIN